MTPFFHVLSALVLGLALLATTGCDPQRISELQPGVSTETDVRERFGEPENVWNTDAGVRTFEYNRQPAGQVNYMIDLGADGKLIAVRQVLTPENFAKVQPGMPLDTVRRMLGKAAKVAPYPLKNETHVQWRFANARNEPQVFTVVQGPGAVVLRTETGPDLDAPEFKGGK
jgi:hypothetical protein